MLKLFNKEMIIVDPKVDCIVFDGQVVIFEKGNFEKIFSYDHVYHEHSNKFFNFMDTDCPYRIRDLDKIRDQCISGNKHLLLGIFEIPSKGEHHLFVRLL